MYTFLFNGEKLMNSFIVLFGKEIPIYGLCWMLGIALAAVVAAFLMKKQKVEMFDLAGSAVFAVVAGLIGSKLLFIAVTLKTIIENNIPIEAVIKGGFVFYGGLIGGIIGLYIYTKMFKMRFGTFADVFGVVVPLGHCVGRIGCHFAGCCYGMEYSGPFAVTYNDVLGAVPNGVSLFPVQLLEAVLLFLLFIVLLILYFKKKGEGFLAAGYLISYAIIRFILEFFRGDKARGILLGLSTSQIISILIIVCVTVILILNKRKKKTA